MLAWALAIWTLAGGELRWEAPLQCPSAEAVQTQIDQAGGLGDLEVDAVVTPGPGDGEWTLTLRTTLDAVSDERTLRDEDCGALAEAAALLVSTRLDPEGSNAGPALAEPESEPPEGPPEPEEPEEPEEPGASPPRQSARVPAEPPQRRVEVDRIAPALPSGLSLSAAAGLSLGSVPAPGVSSEVAVGHAWPHVRASVRARMQVASPLGLDDGGSIRVLVGTAGPRVCARPRWRRLEFPVCGEVGIGGSRAIARGSARDRGGVWLEAGLGAGLAWFVDPRWALTAQLAGSAPLLGTGYAAGTSRLWDPAPVAGRVMLGVEFLVPIQIGSRPEKSQ